MDKARGFLKYTRSYERGLSLDMTSGTMYSFCMNPPEKDTQRFQETLLILLVLTLVALPYLYAIQGSGPDHVFGGFLINPLDGNSYLAKMYQGWRGDFRFTLPYTAEAGDGAYLFIFYIMLGHLSRIINLPIIVTFHIARLLAALFMLLALRRTYTILLPSLPWFGLVFALAALGSGSGWLFVPFGTFTSDFWVVEAYPFLSAYSNPHFPLGLALLLLIVTIPYITQDWGNRAHVLRSGLPVVLGSILLAIISPFGVVLALAVLGVMIALLLINRFYIYQWTASRPRPVASSRKSNDIDMKWLTVITARFIWVLAGGILILLYYYWVARTDPVLAGWNSQNLTPSPPVWDLVISLSPTLLLAIPGVVFVFRQKKRQATILALWLCLGVLLLYLPWGLQRRFMMGLFVPIVALAGLGLEWFASRYKKRARILGLSVVVLSLLTNTVVLFVAIHGIQIKDSMLYLTRGEAKAMAWIEENTPPDALILASPGTGLLIPAHTGRRVIYGHPFETVNAKEEKNNVTQFFQGNGDLSQGEFLISRCVEFIFYGPRERALGDLPQLHGLTLLYSLDDVMIYSTFDITGRCGR